MNILAFDTCLDKTYVSLYDGNEIFNKVILSNEENYHSAYLISTIVEMLQKHNLTPKDINCVATDIGPGSFTGIRACTTVARMFAQQLNIKAVGISSLEILSKCKDDFNIVTLDARKNKAYLYDKGIKGAVDLEEVEKYIKDKKIIADNSMYEKFKAIAKEATSYQTSSFQLGEIIIKIALEKLKEDNDYYWSNLKPLYIQPPPVFGK